jgi:hypothetical protein
MLFIKNNPNVIRNDIEKTLRKQYAWLRRYRKDWLNLILPEPINSNIDRRKRKNYVDWNERDNKLLSLIQKIINDK